jgi:hypothetical protein
MKADMNNKLFWKFCLGKGRTTTANKTKKKSIGLKIAQHGLVFEGWLFKNRIFCNINTSHSASFRDEIFSFTSQNLWHLVFAKPGHYR